MQNALAPPPAWCGPRAQITVWSGTVLTWVAPGAPAPPWCDQKAKSWNWVFHDLLWPSMALIDCPKCCTNVHFPVTLEEAIISLGRPLMPPVAGGWDESSSQRMVPKPTASASPGNLLERKQTDLHSWKIWELGPAVCDSASPQEVWVQLNFENHCSRRVSLQPK